eukprot:SAG31_NODE_975_length_10623_cov_7.244964_9_plen_204_part_00
MRATPRISSLLLIATICGAPSDAAAISHPHQHGTAEPSCAALPTAAPHRARRLCSGTPTRDALLVAGLSATVADAATGVLLGHGFETALDLQLLVGQQLQEELAAELKTSGLSIGDRAKIQLLVGDGAERDRHPGESACATGNGCTQWTGHIGGGLRRRQQSSDESRLSTDTLAIVLSMLVGAMGCESPPRVSERFRRDDMSR